MEVIEMIKQKDESRQISTEEAARILGCSTATIYRLIARGLIKRHKKPYGQIRVTFDESEIRQLLASVEEGI